jgi:hypothetical protein
MFVYDAGAEGNKLVQLFVFNDVSTQDSHTIFLCNPALLQVEVAGEIPRTV